MNQMQQAGNLGARPLIALSTPEGSASPESARIKQQLENEMASLSIRVRVVRPQAVGGCHASN
jgi:hypothetical protein